MTRNVYHFLILSQYKDFSCIDVMVSAELIQVTNSRSLERCCTGNIKTCQDVEIDSGLLGLSLPLTILNVTLTFSGLVPPSGYVYKNHHGDEAVITHSNRSGNVFGSFKTHHGNSYGIEKCQTKQVLKEFDMETFYHEETVQHQNSSGNVVLSPLQAEGLQRALTDNTTTVSYSVMFYYTRDFAKITADIAGYVDQLLAETNQGYVNSEVPLLVTKHCISPASLSDIPDTITMLNNFAEMKELTYYI